MGILKSETYKKGIISSVSLNFFSKILTFANTALIAYYFGTSATTDIFYFVFSIIGLVSGLITVINSAVVIPEGMRLKERDSESRSMLFYNEALKFYIIVCIIISAALFLWPTNILSTISNFNKDQLVQHQNLVYLFIPLLILITVTQHFKDILSTYKFFTLPIIISILNSVFSISFMLGFQHSGDIKFAVLGIVFGYTVALILELVILVRKLKWNFSFRSKIHTKQTKHAAMYWYFSNLISLPCSSLYLYLISNEVNGYLTSYNLALQLSLLPTQFILIQVTSILAVKFNEHIAKDEKKIANNTFYQSGDIVLFLIIAVCSLFFLNATEIVTLLFKRGKFSVDSVQKTVMIFKYLVLAVPFSVLVTFTSIMLMSAQKVPQVFWYQIISNIAQAFLVVTGFYFWKINGFLIGFLLYTVLNNIGMKILYRHIPYINYNKLNLRLYLYLSINTILVGSLIFIFHKYLTVQNIFLAIIFKSICFSLLLIVALKIFSLNNYLLTEFLKIKYLIVSKLK